MWSLTDKDKIKHAQSLDPFGLHLFIITWLFSTIASIANRDQVSTYITDDRKSPTSTGLSMAKHRTSYSY
jgi:hypothetical protein